MLRLHSVGDTWLYVYGILVQRKNEVVGEKCVPLSLYEMVVPTVRMYRNMKGDTFLQHIITAVYDQYVQ